MDEDLVLIEEIRRGSPEAFTRFVGKYQAKVRSFLGRYLRDLDVVDDLAQEVFLASLRGVKSYRGESSPVVWLLGIARNLALRHLRDQGQRHVRLEPAWESALSDWTAERLRSQAASVERHDEILNALQSCLDKLQAHSAALVQDIYFKGRTAAQVARETGKSEGAVWMLLLRIRQTLRECVKTQLPTEVV